MSLGLGLLLPERGDLADDPAPEHQHADDEDAAHDDGDPLAQPGEVVLLSPACKSFDMYNNYEERGRDFKHHVAQLLKG